MSRVIDATVFIAGDDSMASSSSDYHTLLASGDTIRIGSFRTPITATDAGYPGEICVDEDYIYVCVAVNVWHRAAHSIW